jgi:hypothetical protein
MAKRNNMPQAYIEDVEKRLHAEIAKNLAHI